MVLKGNNRLLRMEKLKRLIKDKKHKVKDYETNIKNEKEYLASSILKNQSGKGRDINTAKIRKTIKFYEGRLKKAKLSVNLMEMELKNLKGVAKRGIVRHKETEKKTSE